MTRPGTDKGAGLHNVLPQPQGPNPMGEAELHTLFESSKTKQEKIEILVRCLSSNLGNTGHECFNDYR